MDASTPQSKDIVHRIARLFRRDLDTMPGPERFDAAVTIWGVVLATPLALTGLIWLALSTDWTVFLSNWLVLFVVAIFLIILNRLRFYVIAALNTPGQYGNAAGTLEGAAKWSALFIFGPAVIWIDLLINIALLLFNRQNWQTPSLRWALARDTAFTTTTVVLFTQIALALYENWGGTFPLPGMSFHTLLLGLGSISIHLILNISLIITGYLGYTLWAMRRTLSNNLFGMLPRLLALGLGIPFIASLFSIPLAGIYVQGGWFSYLAFLVALLLVSLLANRMSQANEDSRMQSVQLEKLEALGRAVISSPSDASTLPELLSKHAPAMFTFSNFGIWVGNEILMAEPPRWEIGEQEAIRKWIGTQKTASSFTTQDPLPWVDIHQPHLPVITAPILDSETGNTIGGAYVELASLGQEWNRKNIQRQLPSLQGLGAQVSAALQQARVYKQTLAILKTRNELEVARQIQTSFLPHEIQPVPGWDIAASLEPAREMAGDFYDIIPLSNGRLGLLIGDVADKGVGPALYMALTRTLVRTYASQYELEPERVMKAANIRILQDAGDTIFVTAFYGVLDTTNGKLLYVNAGHNPPWILSSANAEILSLRNTGMALGVDEVVEWKRGETEIAPNSLLFLYTDGATDAQNPAEDFLGVEQLEQTIRSGFGETSDAQRNRLVEQIGQFSGDAVRFDDITLMFVQRR